MKWGPDRYTFSGGMISWYFTVGDLIYRVNSQQYWEHLPRAEIMGILYRHDRKRLLEWIEARDKQFQRPVVKLARTRYMGPPRPRGRPAFLEPEERERRKRENWKKQNQRRQGGENKRALPRWPNLIKGRLEFWSRPNGSKYYAAFPLTDHDFIEAMFWLYSQERSRLLA